jgi:hypothetical protein
MKSKIIDTLIVFGTLFAIAMFLILLYYSITFWTKAYIDTTTIQAKMFWIGLLWAIIYSIGNQVLSLIRESAKNFKSLLGRREVVNVQKRTV